MSFEHFALHQEKTLRITSTRPAGANMHGDPIFLLQFLNVLYMAGICVKFEKNLDSTSFSSDLYTLRVLRLDSQKSIHNLDPKKLLTQPNIEKYYSFQDTKIIRTFLKKTKTSELGTHYVTCRGDRSLLVCTREFWLKSLSPKQNFVAGRSREHNQIKLSLCDLLGRQNSVEATKILQKFSTWAHTEGLILGKIEATLLTAG